MKWFVTVSHKIGTWMNVIAGILVYVMMVLTVADIIMRYFGRPILGSYELVAIMGATIIGFAMPKTSLDRGHICVDLVMDGISGTAKGVLYKLTRIPSMAFFIALMLFLVVKGRDLYLSHDASSVLAIPRYFLVFILAFCCFAEVLALVADFVVGWPKERESE